MRLLNLICGVSMIAFSLWAQAQQIASPKELFPPRIGAWRLIGVQAFDAKTIYDYMNGAADPYMNFTYKQMYMGRYELGNKKIVVELYDMGTPIEAFGAYTLDVDGKPIEIGTEALLSESALRIWKGPYFIKIFDFSSGPVDSEAARDIGTAIATKIEAASEKPKLLALIPASLKPNKIRYFHQAATLSEIYYISTKNVLELSAQTEGVWAECDSGKIKIAIIRYPNAETRDKAWAGFCNAIFMQPNAGKGPEPIYAEQLEPRSSTGLRKFSGSNGEPLLALCFEARNVEQCKKILDAIGGADMSKNAK